MIMKVSVHAVNFTVDKTGRFCSGRMDKLENITISGFFRCLFESWKDKW
jgi:hypothetical protein